MTLVQFDPDQPFDSTAGALDGLVADGQAIGVRVVLDLTAHPADRHDAPAASVLVPDSTAALLGDYSSYGV